MLRTKIILGFMLATLLPILVYYGVNHFTPNPRWGDYHRIEDIINSQKAPLNEQFKMAQERKDRRQIYKEKQAIFAKTFFYTSIPLGYLAVFLGAIISLQILEIGLMFGGSFLLLAGYFKGWSHVPIEIKFFSLLIGFIFLIYIDYCRLENQNGLFKTKEEL